MGDIGIKIVLHKVHGAHDMDVIKIRLFVIVFQMLAGTKFGIRVENAGAGKETVDQVGIKSYFGAVRNGVKKGVDVQVMVKLLKEK